MDDVNVNFEPNADGGEAPGSRNGPEETKSRQPLEDRALKLAAQFFGEELLPRLGIAEKILRIAPTEQIYLHIKGLQEDFNYEMMNRKWYHFEFASKPLTREDLMRFRSYESVTSFYYGVEVITCVICTANVKTPKLELKQGINRYRVLVYHLKGADGDEVIRLLEEKQQTQRLDRGDLAELLLTPLMSGEMAIAERIEKSVRMIQKERKTLGAEDQLRMESVLYAFAMKFLSEAELKDMKEVFGMTVLGQMLEDRGVEKGIVRGIQALAETCLELKVSREDTLSRIKEKFHLSEDEAEAYLKKYWTV